MDQIESLTATFQHFEHEIGNHTEKIKKKKASGDKNNRTHK